MELIDNYRHKYNDCEVNIYWCPYCGSILNWWDEKPIQDDDWKEPIMTKSIWMLGEN